MADYQSTHTGAEIDAGIDLLDKNSATSGQVLTADGVGGASWQNASGGSGGTQLYMHTIQITTGDTEIYNFISKQQSSIISYADFETFILSGDWQFISGRRMHGTEIISMNVYFNTDSGEALLNTIAITEYNQDGNTVVYTEDILGDLGNAISYNDEVTPL